MKNKLLNKIGAVVISASLTISSFAGSAEFFNLKAFAAGKTGTTETGITYECVNGIMAVTGYTGNESDIVIPATIDGIKVTSIATGSFKEAQINSVDIQAKLTVLNESVFENSTVSKVTLPSTIKKINRYAFYNCQSLTSINFPEGLLTIGNNAFSNTHLGDIVFPESLQEIGNYAFSGTYGKITSIKVTGKTSIGNDAFQGAALKTVDLGTQSTTIGGSAFYCCYELENIKFSPTNTFGYGGVGGILGHCESLKNVDLSELQINYLPEDMFYNCTALETVTLPSTCVSIGKMAFYNCKYLENIVIPESCQTISDEAFREATYLLGIYIPETTTSISETAFDGCNYLTISASPDSAAAKFAEKYSIPLVEITSGSENDSEAVNGEISDDDIDSLVAGLPIVSDDVVANFDSNALQEMKDNVGGKSFKFVFERFLSEYYPNQNMKYIIDEAYKNGGFLFDCNFYHANKKFEFNTTANDGSVSLTIPVEPGNYSDFTVYHVDSTGKKSEMNCKYNKESGTVTFTTNHFSYFVVVPKLMDCPENITAACENGKVTVSWQKVAGATSYRIFRSTSKTGTKTMLKAVTTTSFTDTTVEAGKTYYYYVKAYNGTSGNLSDYSAVKAITVPSGPAAPKNVKALSGGGNATITWDAVSDATSYRVFRSTSLTGTRTLEKVRTSTYYIDTNVDTGKTYYYWIVSYNANTGLKSGYSACSSVKIVDTFAKTIEIKSASVLSTSVTLKWDMVPGATSYRIYRRNDDNSRSLIHSQSMTEFKDTGLTKGKAYRYEIRAYSATTKALTDYSAIKQVRPMAAPTIQSGNVRGKITWDKNAVATSYRVYRADSLTGAKKLLDPTKLLTYTDTTAVSGKTYYYFVAAYDNTTGTLSAYSQPKVIKISK